MNYGNILTTTWKRIWQNKSIIWFGMLMMLGPALIGLLMGGYVSLSSPGQIERFFESEPSDVVLLIFFFAYFFFIAFTIGMTAISFVGVLKGTLMTQNSTTPLTFSELWEASLPYFWRMLGVMFSVGFMLFMVYMVPVVVLALFGAVTAGVGFLCAIPFMLLLIPVGIVGYLLFSLSMAALVAEDGTVFDTIRSAWTTLRAKFWPLVLMTVILYMLQFGVGLVIAIPMNVIQFAFMIPMSASNVDPAEMLRYFGIFLALFIPLSSIVQSLGLTYVNSAWMLTWLEAGTPPSVDPEDEIIEYAA